VIASAASQENIQALSLPMSKALFVRATTASQSMRVDELMRLGLLAAWQLVSAHLVFPACRLCNHNRAATATISTTPALQQHRLQKNVTSDVIVTQCSWAMLKLLLLIAKAAGLADSYKR
jgi:hypothetical protein